MQYLLLALFAVSCTMGNKGLIRVPGSITNHLPDNYEFTKEVKIYSGPGPLATDYPVARSIANADITVNILKSAPGVFCKIGEDGQYTQNNSFVLKNNANGFQEALYCKLEHDGSDFPISENLNVKYSIANRTKFMLLEQEPLYSAYKDLLQQHQEESPSPELFQYVEDIVPTVTATYLGWSNNFSTTTKYTKTSVEIMFYEGSAEFKRNFLAKRETASSQGIEVSAKEAKRLINPKYRAYELICELADKVIRGSEFSKYVLYDYSGDLKCYINLYKKMLGSFKEDIGIFNVKVRAISHSDLEQLLNRSIKNEDYAHKKKIEKLWQDDINSFDSMWQDVAYQQKVSQRSFEKRTNEIKEQKRVAKRDKIINSLFDQEVQGSIGKGMTEYKLQPMEKKYFSPSGEIKSKAYLLLTNVSYGVFKSKQFNFSFEYTPFAEDLKIFLKSDDEFTNDLKDISIKICNTQKKSFFAKLMSLQKQGNNHSLSISDYVNNLKRFAFSDIRSCRVIEGSDQMAVRSESFYLIGDKKDKKVAIKKVGAKYNIPYNSIKLEHIFERSAPSHPLINKEMTIKSASYKNFEDNGRTYLQVNRDQFVGDTN